MITDTDLIISALAQDVAQLEHDLVAYREMVQLLLEQLHEAQRQDTAWAEQAQALRDELRRYVAARV